MAGAEAAALTEISIMALGEASSPALEQGESVPSESAQLVSCSPSPRGQAISQTGSRPGSIVSSARTWSQMQRGKIEGVTRNS